MKNGKREKKPLSASESRQVVVLHPPVNFFSICLSRDFFVGWVGTYLSGIERQEKRESRVHLNQDRKGEAKQQPSRRRREKESVRPREGIKLKNQARTEAQGKQIQVVLYAVG